MLVFFFVFKLKFTYWQIDFRKELYSIAESALWNLGQKAMALDQNGHLHKVKQKNHPKTSGIAHIFN
jgi:hypothetical protein